MKKLIYPILFLIVIGIGYVQYTKNEMYQINLFYMDTYINVKIYTNSDSKAEEILNNVDIIYQDYHILSSKYDSYEEIKNIYYINNNLGTYEIDNKLYDLIEYGIDWYETSNGLLNINIGGVTDLWNEHLEQGTIPSLTELESIDTNISNIELLGNNTITNYGVNLDLGAIAKGYASEIVKEYLEEELDYYLINAGGNVVAGEKEDSIFSIGITDPTENEEIFQIINANNVSVVTSGSYERFTNIDGTNYHHIINPNTLFPSDYMLSVTIVSSDSALADSLSTILFNMSIEDGISFLEDYDAQAIFYDTQGNIYTTEGFSQYE
ncbi:MAG: FAD:protein FMN transferase [Mycoplasmatota bacterium]